MPDHLAQTIINCQLIQMLLLLLAMRRRSMSLLKAYAIMYVIKAIRELITNNKYLIKIQKPKNKKKVYSP